MLLTRWTVTQIYQSQTQMKKKMGLRKNLKSFRQVKGREASRHNQTLNRGKLESSREFFGTEKNRKLMTMNKLNLKEDVA